jgi:carnitine 3-dehydrogenase
MKSPERFLVAHPFNPVYLLPMVELVGGKQTAEATLVRAETFFQSLGMFPLRIKTEIEAFIADRLLEAVWREALWLVKDDIATTQDIDDAIRLGFGLRWAQMGLFETYRIAGGEAGMRHFLKQFGPCLKWPWSKLTDVPELDQALIEKISLQSDEQSGALSIRELEQQRDDNLVLIMQALKKNNWGAGQILSEYEDQLLSDAQPEPQQRKQDIGQVLETVKQIVPEHWTDYNGHMNESRYMECFSNASDELMGIIGVDDHYLEHSGSYFTVETHIQHKGETKAGQFVHVTTQLLSVTPKKLHLFHRLELLDGTLLATGEHMLIHVNLSSRRSSEADEKILSRAREIACEHVKLPLPSGLGRSIGQPPE